MVTNEFCESIGGNIDGGKCTIPINNEISTKESIRELRDLRDKVTTSDLQGIIMAKAIRMKIPSEKRNEAEDIMIHFAEGDMDINSAKRFLDDMRYED